MPKVLNISKDYIPADAVYIGRGTAYGNPYKIGVHGTRALVIEMYEMYVLPNLDLTELRGKDLVCHCAPSKCHGDLLLKAANTSSLREWL